MRKTSIALIVAATASLTAGCASAPSAIHVSAPRSTTMQQPQGNEPGKTAPSVQAVPLSSLPAPSQPLPLLSPEQTTGLCTMSWNLVTIQPNGRNLVLVIPDSRQVVKGATVTSTRDEVTVTLYRTPPPTGPVTSASLHTTILVQLPEPLAGRPLRGESGGACT
jgi:hypothetical protein